MDTKSLIKETEIRYKQYEFYIGNSTITLYEDEIEKGITGIDIFGFGSVTVADLLCFLLKLIEEGQAETFDINQLNNAEDDEEELISILNSELRNKLDYL